MGRSAPSLDLLVAGLGNPEKRYAGSPHNVGFMVIEELARRHGVKVRGKFSGRIGDVRLGDARLALLQPMTYMNESGRSVGPAMRFYKLAPEALLVVHDEVDLDPGRIQVREGGGLAGHKGLKSIVAHLGTPDFLRVRVGVGRPGRGDRRSVADYVLAPFSAELDVESIVERAADAVESLVHDGLDEAQRRYNGELPS
ncbi:MAG: aminoacyl-tRNA hydrolase [Gaiellaceae bacterium]